MVAVDLCIAVDLYIAVLFAPQFVSNKDDIRQHSNNVRYEGHDLYLTCSVVSKQNPYNRLRQRPNHVQNTGSCPKTAVKQSWEWLVLGWVTATDYGLDGPGSNPGGGEFSVCPDRPWGPPSVL